MFSSQSRPFHDGFLDDVGSSSVFGSDPFPGYDLQSSTPRSRSPNVNVEKTIKMTLNLPDLNVTLTTSDSDKELRVTIKKMVSYLNKMKKDERRYQTTQIITKPLLKFEDTPKGVVIAELLAEFKFADVTMYLLRNFHKTGMLKSDDRDIQLASIMLLECTWNYSNKSTALTENLLNVGLLKLLLKLITFDVYVIALPGENAVQIIKCSLGILHNMSKLPDVKRKFREHGAVGILLKYCVSENKEFKTLAMLTLTAIVEEAENAQLNDCGSIPFMVDNIRQAVSTSDRTSQGFSAAELTEGLARMALNDNNKCAIINEDALNLFVDMLTNDDASEQNAAGKVIWTLGFDDSAKQKIVEEPGCIEALEKLIEESDDTSVKQQATGALWVAGVKQCPHTDEDKILELSDGDKHVFISYSWNNQEMCIAIKDRLKRDGYRVWMDVDKMSGSTLEAMAHAVENAAVVLIGACEKYKNSPNCRTEADYTHALHKDLIPLMLEENYRADGWLGILMGSKLYFNFDGTQMFDKAYEMLVKEIGQRGKMAEPPIIKDTTPALETTPPPPNSGDFTNWTPRDVGQWLDHHNLQHLKSKFSEFDGLLLKSLQEVQIKAPEYFYGCLRTEFQISFADSLRLTTAINCLCHNSEN